MKQRLNEEKKIEMAGLFHMASMENALRRNYTHTRS